MSETKVTESCGCVFRDLSVPCRNPECEICRAAFQETVKTWEVEVRVNGTDILTIGSSHLCGVNNIDDYADTVRMAAEHLLAFIGLPAPSREDIDHGTSG